MSNAIASEQVIKVNPGQATVCCRGANNGLGHPAVYLTFAGQSTVQCYYCGRVFSQAMGDNEQTQEEG